MPLHVDLKSIMTSLTFTQSHHSFAGSTTIYGLFLNIVLFLPNVKYSSSIFYRINISSIYQVLVTFFTYSKEFSYTVHNFYERIRNNRNEELLELISNEDINFYLNNYSNKIILF